MSISPSGHSANRTAGTQSDFQKPSHQGDAGLLRALIEAVDGEKHLLVLRQLQDEPLHVLPLQGYVLVVVVLPKLSSDVRQLRVPLAGQSELTKHATEDEDWIRGLAAGEVAVPEGHAEEVVGVTQVPGQSRSKKKGQLVLNNMLTNHVLSAKKRNVYIRQDRLSAAHCTGVSVSALMEQPAIEYGSPTHSVP